MFDAGDAQGAQHGLDFDGLGFGTIQTQAGAWMGLAARHGGGGVIQHDDSDVVAVVDGVGDAGHGTGKERGVAYKSDLLSRGFGNT